jgi:hypothetical protein
VIGEWAGPPDADAALDYYTRLVDQVHGRISKAENATELNATLRVVLARLFAWIDGDRLHVEFELVRPREFTDETGYVHAWAIESLPPRDLSDDAEPEPWQTGPQTKVNVPIWHGVPIPPLEVAMA